MNKMYNTIINFNDQPVSNRFLKTVSAKAPYFPLKLSWNKDIGCPKILKPWPVEELKPKYNWITCFEPEEHLDELCSIIQNLNKNKNITIGAYSFKDDSTLQRLNKLGYKNQWRIDPIKDLKIDDPLSNIETFQSVFKKTIANSISIKKGKADILIVRHVIEHAYDINEFIASLKLLINKDGLIVFELPDCKPAFKNGDCTTIWEEHTSYFFESSFRRCLNINQMEIVFWKNWEYPLENCMVAIVKNNNTQIPRHDVSECYEDYLIYNNFMKIFNKRKVNIEKKLKAFTVEKGPVCILGAGHLSIAFISLLGLKNLISFAIDDNENKANFFLPIGSIPIKQTSFLNINVAKLCLLGANPQHHMKIKKKLNQFQLDGGIIGSIFPSTDDYVEEII